MARATWRIYLGAAPGVGKTYAMLDEARRRADRGTHVVVGFVDARGRPATEALLAGLERIPRRELAGATALDVAAVIARRPAVCLVDDLQAVNPPGAANRTRWQDAVELVEAGIDVVSTLSIEHLESLQDVVDSILGPAPRATVPDHVVRSADQIELVDMSPEALRRRLAHGNVMPPEQFDARAQERFRPEKLAALRELTLRWVADRVEHELDGLRGPAGAAASEVRERVAVAVSSAPSGDRVIRRAARLADRLGGDLVGIHVRDSVTGDADDAPLASRCELLEDLGGRYVEVVAVDVAQALVDAARAEHATQLVLGATRRSRWAELTSGSVIGQVLRSAGPIDVHVAGEDGSDEPPPAISPRGAAPLAARRRQLGWLLGVAVPPALTAALVQVRGSLELSTVLLTFVLVAVLTAAAGGTGPALLSAGAGFLLANWFFTEPVGSWSITDAEHVVALLLFLVVAAATGAYVSAAARQAADAVRARAEARALARAAATTVSPDPLAALVELVRSEVGAGGVAVMSRDGEDWVTEAAAGTASAAPPATGGRGITLPIGPDAVLVVEDVDIDPGGLGLLSVLAAQLASALIGRRLAVEAAEANELAAANDLRGAILNAVSHDLRTPLATIKAAATSLLANDITWDDAAREEFVRIIDGETDRLSDLVTNLLDLSRIQAGVVRPNRDVVGAEEVVGAALSSLGAQVDGRVQVAVDDALPPVRSDAALLERAVANLVQNALRHAGQVAPVRIEAAAVADRLMLRIVDRGPGIPRAERARLFAPFERAGTAGAPGVGLGLAVSAGFVAALGGQLDVEDTPGGGCTMVVSLPLEPATS